MSIELRDLMNRYADHSQTAALPGAERLSQVRGRVAVVRRRRRGGAAGLAAAALVVAGGVTWWHQPSDRPEPLDRDMAGHVAPESVHRLGMTLDLVKTAEGQRTEHLELPASDEPQVVSWASESAELQLRGNLDVDQDGSLPDRLDSTINDFTDSAFVDPGQPVSLTATASTGKVAFAVYTLVEQPAGVTGNGVTFREVVPDGSLVDAVVGDRGQTEISMRVTLPEGQLRISDVCSVASPSGRGLSAYAQVLANGHPLTTGSCQDQVPFDPGTGGFSQDGPGIDLSPSQHWTPGDTVTLTVRAFEDSAATKDLTDSGAVLGLGVYEVTSQPTTTVQGWDVERTLVDEQGTWSLRPQTSESDGDSITLTVPESDRTLLPYVVIPGNFSYNVEYDGRHITGTSVSVDSPSFEPMPLIRPGQVHTIRIRPEGNAPLEGGDHFTVGFYELDADS